ncbi:hypothetical protein P171DRAFT_55851 [Karstenula rhodostoma CBS 690.94]|uniref:Zn(2)-C6 fungal-type domain-containing protein n=1 Tax=Karstenula rhodostoma CBS 690.94 TaxID=1392251 RepID=A0A9P4UAI6_9PLEO|nr:hypothetical protein P171DRAFT_55851 [Karstenula rhodostoma CBS 690.94]
MSSAGSSVTLVSRPRTRRAAPRVKTGCKTCKIRRVKCDEEKPHCKRCTSTGRKCDGYSTTPNGSHAIVFPVAQTSTIQRAVRSPMADDKDLHFLEFYKHCAAPSMSTDAFDTNFWSQACLQMAQSEASIRHALIAIGYLNRSQTGSLKSARSGLVATSGQETFLTHYNKAIKALAKRIPEASCTPEVGLVTCFIFVGIEVLCGNYDAAMMHYCNGLRILQTLRTKQGSSSGKMLGSDFIEKTLVPLFHRLLTTGIQYGVPTDLAMSLIQRPPDTPQPTFKSVLEAQSAMHELRNQALLFIRHMGENFRPVTPPPEHKLLDQQALLFALDEWWIALEELESSTILSKDDTTTAHALKACYYTTYILGASITDPNQSACDRHLPRFKALVHHCRHVVEHSPRLGVTSPAANFTFEITVIPCLNFAASRCRCPVTRREAVALLERNIPREGLWDAQQQALVCRRLIEIEESEVDPVTGWPTENARVLSTWSMSCVAAPKAENSLSGAMARQVTSPLFAGCADVYWDCRYDCSRRYGWERAVCGILRDGYVGGGPGRGAAAAGWGEREDVEGVVPAVTAARSVGHLRMRHASIHSPAQMCGFTLSSLLQTS